MSFRDKVRKEAKEVGLTTLYFATWFVLLTALKRLILEQYQIEFRGLSLALIGALIVAKVVLVLEYVPIGAWVRNQPAVVNVFLRTLLYTFGVLVALLLEKAFETRHEHGGFGPALVQVFENRDVHHVWANTLCVGWALLGFNALSVVRKHLGHGELTSWFWTKRHACSEEPSAADPERL